MTYSYVDLDHPPTVTDMEAFFERLPLQGDPTISIAKPNFWTFRIVAEWETHTVTAEVIDIERKAS